MQSISGGRVRITVYLGVSTIGVILGCSYTLYTGRHFEPGLSLHLRSTTVLLDND